jgi:hypothetical protein
MAERPRSIQRDSFLRSLERPMASERVYNLSEAETFTERTGRALWKAVESGRIDRQYLRMGEHADGKPKLLFTREGLDIYIATSAASRGAIPSAVVEAVGIARDDRLRAEHEARIATEARRNIDLMPSSLPDAKLRVEQLKIERLEAENMLARNQSMLIEDVIAINREVDMELVASLRSMVYRAAPRLAAESDILKCRVILEQELQESMSVLERPAENVTA